MGKNVERVHWPDAPDVWMPYAPAIKVTGGSFVFVAGVTAAPVYHNHPHRPEEFASMPLDMEGQVRATLDNLEKSLAAAGATMADVVVANWYLTDISTQDVLNKVLAERVGEFKPTDIKVQVAALAPDPRCLLEVGAIAVIG
jgi:enamine deaminase RidA (YjgF/YER057c/UK114 family)